jgi:hypothetical protein
MYNVKERIQNQVILRNQQTKDEQRKYKLKDGIEERDIIIEADPNDD